MSAEQIVIMGLGKELYGISISNVQEIIKPQKVTAVPNCPDFIEGIISLRDEVLPVVDLAKRFGIEASDNDNDRRFVVVNISDTRVAFIVDSVTEVFTLNEENIEPPPSGIGGIDAKFIKGVGKRDGELIILLDVGKIFNPGETSSLKEVT